MIYIKDDCLEEKEIQQLNTLLTHPHQREWGEGLDRDWETSLQGVSSTVFV